MSRKRRHSSYISSFAAGLIAELVEEVIVFIVFSSSSL